MKKEEVIKVLDDWFKEKASEHLGLWMKEPTLQTVLDEEDFVWIKNQIRKIE